MPITVWGKATCAPCHTLKYWLNKKGIDYKYVEGGARVYPTIQIGESIIEGLNWRELTALLSFLTESEA